MEKDAKTYWDESAEDFQRRVAGHGWNLEKDPALAQFPVDFQAKPYIA